MPFVPNQHIRITLWVTRPRLTPQRIQPKPLFQIYTLLACLIPTLYLLSQPFRIPTVLIETPLSDKELCQANDFYLGGRYGKDDADELEALYEVLNLPTNCFQNVLYTFIRVIEEEDVPYLSDKEIKNLPRLSSLEPEAFVDWYDDMESELLMITSVSLLPFDAIVINWQYVGLCIPGIGERRYLEMARVLWRVCEKTLPRDEEAVRNAFKANSNRGRDGFRLLWDVLIRSQPAFNPIKSFPKPT